MQTMQPVLKRGRDVWDPINMNLGEFQGRVARLREDMKKQGIDLLLLYGHGIDEYGNPAYVANVSMKVPRGIMAVVPLQGHPVMIAEGFPRDLPDVKRVTWIGDVRCGPNAAEECLRYIEETSAAGSVIGITGAKQHMPYEQYRFLMDSIRSHRVIEADDIIRSLRTVKSLREIDQIRRASRIASLAFGTLGRTTFPDLTEKGLEAEIDYLARREGAEDVRILMGTGLPRPWPLRPAGMSVIGPGDRVVIYLALAFERYWAEIVGTFVFDSGRLNLHVSERAESLYRFALLKIKPSMTLSNFYDEVVEHAKEMSLELNLDYGLGGGIGLGLNEPPIIDKKEIDVFQIGMCLSLRLAANAGPIDSGMTGHTIALLESGPQILTG